ncbi:phosphatase PAP2 family protein [Cryobacterium algoritolerans]|uniref:phosphatase PAP2 family protein n=1 Tax=Cryobacterium algoritolerans TaxID=1259184 RepID=UPI001F5482FD|nr:phosphatase PAP2 family protein [Cryobacterium algoritolerans]
MRPSQPSPLIDSTTRLAVLPQIRHWVLWPAGLAAGLIIVGLTLSAVRALTAADLGIDQTLSLNHTAFLTAIALTLNALFSPLGGSFLLAVVCLFLAVARRSPVNAAAVGAVSLVGWLSSEVLKAVVGRHRPDASLLAHPLVTERGFDSFPSGHTCLAVSLSIALYFLARGTRWQRLTMIGGGLLSISVAASRIYLGAHYPSDVAASFVASLAAILFFSGLWNRYAASLLSRLGLIHRPDLCRESV